MHHHTLFGSGVGRGAALVPCGAWGPLGGGGEVEVEGSPPEQLKTAAEGPGQTGEAVTLRGPTLQAGACDAAGQPLRGPKWWPWLSAGVFSVATLRAHLAHGRPPLPGCAALLACLPENFAAALTQPLACQWRVEPSLTRVLHVGAGPARLFSVDPTQRLQPCAEPGAMLEDMGEGWEEALVQEWDPARPYRGDRQYAPSGQEVPFLLGPASQVSLCPGVWGRGSFPAHALTVQHSTRRQLLLAAKADKKLLLSPGHAMQPPI